MAADSAAPAAPEAPRRALTAAMWTGLIAAFLGWMFDGMEMGLYSLVIRPALSDLMGTDEDAALGPVISMTLFLFLTGMAAGGILFGRLGDRIGRVKSMAIAILIYAVFTGLSGFTQNWQQLAVCRFLGAMGLGGEWGLGVALVMESWPNASRPLLAGLLGAAANFGFFAASLIGWAARAYNWGWREPLWCGAIPALLVFFLRLGVKEPEKYVRSKERGETSRLGDLFAKDHCRRTLIGSGLGAVAVLGMWGAYQTWAPTWAPKLVAPQSELVTTAAKLAQEADLAVKQAPDTAALKVQEAVSALGPAMAAAREAARRSGTGQAEVEAAAKAAAEAESQFPRAMASSVTTDTDRLMALASRSALDAATKAKGVIKRASDTARAATLMWMAIGSIVGALLGGLIGEWLGRRFSYVLLCLASIVMALLLYLTVKEYSTLFLLYVALAGVPITAFFGWLPLYLPELYPTRLRATGEGFCFNVGRIVSAVGVFGTGALVSAFAGIPYAAATMSGIFLLGIPLVLIAPETKGQELPE